MKRVDVDPSAIRVVGAPGAGRPQKAAPGKGIGAALRARRMGFAAVVAAAEVILLALGHVSVILMLLIAVAAIAFHVYVGRRLPFYLLEQVSWTIALAQVMVALLVIAIGVATFAIFVVLIVLVLGGLAYLVADRR